MAGDSVVLFGSHAWFVCAKGPCTKLAALHKASVNDEDIEVMSNSSMLNVEYLSIVAIVNLN